jgi:ribose 5-phosphate isomerase A
MDAMEPDAAMLKRRAAEAALGQVADGMVLGLGSGSTAEAFVAALGARIAAGGLRDICGVATSERTTALAQRVGVPLTTLERQPQLDLAIDGADEVDPLLTLIKGRGGALLREKVVAASAARFIVIVDGSKLVARLGQRTALPVELVAFATPLVTRQLQQLGGSPALRRHADGSPFITDEGHVILDTQFAAIDAPDVLASQIAAIPGVAAHGLFVGLASAAIVASHDGITWRRR